jgi:hypothetical protein
MTPWRPDLPPEPRPARSPHREELWHFLGLMTLLAACALVLAFG